MQQDASDHKILSSGNGSQNARMPDREPLCYAPFTSFKIDTGKGVRPCSSWEGNYFGNIMTEDLNTIVHSHSWKLLQSQMLHGEWPKGCMACKTREMYNGESLRNNFKENTQKYLSGNGLSIFEMEFDSSNICNLACVHCSSDYSSSWVEIEQLLKEDGFNEMRTKHVPQNFKPDSSSLIRSLKGLDLQNLRLLKFKGGEPFLNKEIKPLLQFLEDKDYLKNIQLQFVTNGTVMDKSYLEILSKSKSVHFEISVDGTGILQEYIRWGAYDAGRLENFISFFAQLTNSFFTPLVSVMVYNVFGLDHIMQWWRSIHAMHGDKTSSQVLFTHAVISPKYLSVNVLAKETRAKLASGYEKLDPLAYAHVIRALKGPWAGKYWHQKFVHYTGLMDKYRKVKIVDIVPELESELKGLEHVESDNLDALIQEIDFLVENDCATANHYLKRAFLKMEKKDMHGARKDFDLAFRLDINLFNAVPSHWLG